MVFLGEEYQPISRHTTGVCVFTRMVILQETPPMTSHTKLAFSRYQVSEIVNDFIYGRI